MNLLHLFSLSFLLNFFAEVLAQVLSNIFSLTFSSDFCTLSCHDVNFINRDVYLNPSSTYDSSARFTHSLQFTSSC